jgi:hypothetical protein
MNKKEQVKGWMERTAKTDAEIATLVECDYEYVAAIREELGITDEGMAQLVYTYSQGKGRTPPEQDDLTKTLEERGSRYGKFTDHAEITQTFKVLTRGYLEERNKLLDDDQQEALDMIFHKIGRIINGDPDYADSWIDIAGYAKLVADRLEGTVR